MPWASLHVVDRMPLDSAVAALLSSYTERPIGEAKAPTKPGDDESVAEVPYAILYPITGGRFWGPPLSYAEECADLHYQVTCVGIRQDQAVWMASRVREAILGRDDTGAYALPLVAPGLNVMMRESAGPPGGPMQAGSIWSVIDVYSISVQAL